MKAFPSCKAAIQSCLSSRTFAIAHLYNDEKVMNIHIHDCYEIYYSISGGKQFLIDNRFYAFHPGDIFFINQYESHHVTQIDSERHERIVLSIHPEYLQGLSTANTNLNYCFSFRGANFGHKLSLTPREQQRFLYLIHKLSTIEGFGEDVLEQAAFLELMTFLNWIFLKHCEHDLPEPEIIGTHHEQIDAILSYVNQHIAEELSIQKLADSFFLSTSYLCKIFKRETGTTINKYVTAKRITLAKSLLSEGYSVTETCARCGFGDYSNFLKAFTKAVGISPKKYAQFSHN